MSPPVLITASVFAIQRQAKPVVPTASTHARRRTVQSLVMLAGGSGLKPWETSLGRSSLDLPIGHSRTVLSLWRDQIRGLNDSALASDFRAHVVGGAPVRSLGTKLDDLRRIEHLQDPQEVRGSGGVLRDVTAALPDDANILVVSAASIVLEPLGEMLNELLATDADVSFFVHEDQIAGGVMLVRCGCLRAIPAVGFIDFKEQALPVIRRFSTVAAIRRNGPVAMSVRTAADYIRALRRQADGREAEPQSRSGSASADAFAEGWRPSFRLVEDGADVDDRARIHDSVVLGGASVARDALVVRSVICPGAKVPANAVIVDQVVQSSRSRPGGATAFTSALSPAIPNRAEQQ